MDATETHGPRTTASSREEWELIGGSSSPILSVRDLKTRFKTRRGTVHAVDGVSLEINAGETLGLVGESGCGKSATALSIMGLIRSPGEVVDGEVVFEGEDFLEMSAEQQRRIRGRRMSMIFQEPMNALNPVYKIGWQIGMPLRVHQDLSKHAERERAIELMERVGIPNPIERIDDYPHEFSGGMRQRAMIAMALACQPALLVADEPTTALDVTIEAQILDLLSELKEEYQMSMLLITHDLGVVAKTCDRVAVMYAGRIVEYGDVRSVFKDPRHPYTMGLLSCIPNPFSDDQELSPIEGQVPDLVDPPDGCNYRERCEFAADECRATDPRLREVSSDHYSACIWRDPR